MFCNQCEETINGIGCTKIGVCGKTAGVSELHDLLIYSLKGISYYSLRARKQGIDVKEANEFIMESLFATITNANFDSTYFIKMIKKSFDVRDKIKNELNLNEDKSGSKNDGVLSDALNWKIEKSRFLSKAKQVGILSTANEDIRSLRSTLLYGVMGMSAYIHHAYMLKYSDEKIFEFIEEALVATIDDSIEIEQVIGLVMKCGEIGLQTMELLDKANTTTFGNPEISKVNLGVRNNPGILISGHDLKDIDELLAQTEGCGVDIYTHSEMLPAHSYPKIKKYKHLAGNYGGSWWKQNEEFEKFNGPILMTTNCLVPPKLSYEDRVYTTGIVRFSGLKHIADRKATAAKDFSQIIEHAKKCKAPTKIEEGEIIGGFAHQTIMDNASKVIELINNGKIKKFVVMAGCDGRQKDREYYTEFAQNLPKDTIILTAGCAKYRYNKLKLGEIEGIPRVLDAGQCNDSYSLIFVAKQLSNALGKDINQLPIIYNIAWYEQKAVLVLLALLHVGVKNIHIGPKLPAFLSPTVLNVLVDKFELKKNSTVEEDMKTMIVI